MTCEEVPGVIDAYLDGELSVTATLQVHEHFAACENCRRILESEAALHGLLVQEARAEAVPARLRTHILGNLATTEPARGWPARRLAMRFGIISGFVGLAVLGWIATERIASHPMTPLAAELASKHLLYGEGHGGALELVTSEPAKMGTWFKGRLGFPVRLPSVARRPERLVGGRISSVADSPAAYALYDRSGQSLSLFVTRRVPFARRGWTERHVDGAEMYFASLRGVALVWWEEKQVDRLYAAVSGGDEEALVEFALLCIKAGQSRPAGAALPVRLAARPLAAPGSPRRRSRRTRAS
jgi:anti-sigma factor (TIGR02949 family)